MKPLILLILLSSCAGPSESERTYDAETRLRNQSVIINYKGMPCLFYRGGYPAGVSCDWTKYRGDK